MTVIITDFARISLQLIYDYYTRVAAHKADEIVEGLLQRIRLLEEYPLSGPVDPFYVSCGFDYRFLVHNHYKIIYKVEGDTVFIMRFFDARQNPDELLSGEVSV